MGTRFKNCILYSVSLLSFCPGSDPIHRAFSRAFLARKFARYTKNSYLCIVKEKTRNLRPN